MADNLTTQSTTPATVPASSAIATDDVSGVHYQRMKLVDGTLDNTTGIASGNGAASAALRVTVASDSTGTIVIGAGANAIGSVTVTGTTAISAASLPLPTGAATSAAQTTAQTSLTSIDGKLTSVAVTGTFFQATQPVSAAALPLPSGAATSANQTTELASLASIDTKLTSPVTTKIQRSTTPGQTSPAPTGSTTTVLASNANRIGATVFNESTATAYLKLGATASLTSYSLQLLPGAYYEVPFSYTGVIDGITAGQTAQLRVTELT